MTSMFLEGHVSMMERLLRLRALPAFVKMTDAELSVIAHHAKEVYFSPGEDLIREGNLVQHTLAILEGEVEVLRGGVVTVPRTRKNGLGSLNMLARYHAEHQVRAVTHLRALAIKYDRLLELMEDTFTILTHILNVLADATVETYCEMDIDFHAPDRLRPKPSWLRIDGRPLDLVERILSIRQIPAFARSSLDSVSHYAGALEQIQVPAGTVIWAEGDPCFHYLHVVDGVVRGHRKQGEGILRFSTPSMPGFFGAISDRDDRWYTAMAETDLIALRADREVLPDILEDNFEMASLFLTLVARRLVRFLKQRDQTQDDSARKA